MNNKKVNSDIKSNRVMVIGIDGSKLGNMPTNIALSKARNQGYDLVEVSSKSNPPICKIMDYGKYQFDQQKQERKNKAKNKVHLKEIRMKTVIADNDLTTKVKKCIDFLNKGNKVKVSISTHPRRQNDKDVALNIMKTISEILGDFGSITAKPKLEGRFLNAFFTPN